MWTIFTFQFHDLHEKHKNLRALVESDELRDVNFSGFAFIFELNEACERNFLGSNFFPSSQGGKFIFISRPWNFLSSHTLITDCPIFIASTSLWMIWILFRLRVFVMKTGRPIVEQSNSCVNFQGNQKKLLGRRRVTSCAHMLPDGLRSIVVVAVRCATFAVPLSNVLPKRLSSRTKPNGNYQCSREISAHHTDDWRIKSLWHS